MVCHKCKSKPVIIKEPVCMKCGKALKSDAEYCSDCLNVKHEFVRGRAVLDYGSIADSLYRFKNKGRREYATFYAKLIYERNKSFLNSIKPDVFVPVPVHISKLKIRGYNQSYILSKELSKLTGIPTDNNLIKRVKKTNPLKDLSKEERQNHLKSAFKVYDNDVKLKTIVIIDDIYTTGSTIDAMARAIKRVMSCDIYFLTITIGRGV